ncbi:alpha/beta fold hydrolase [Labrys wisconsinensis]|uniref:Pimeloyl-ACP methyl ester carboxylesterase n=1 Tax=Labrys wisconsinensis TaxID=425677 RepID=A0ABU0JG72_9HYPH|nr:alpha/beta hydrolase [Labrys wisconsinensis]MDQ0473283.1 pimeloyl-ACP methyl ester carboxylesterase [Labrys wisconsinensis]
MSEREIGWSTGGAALRLGLDEEGAGPAVLLLPALSSISTRAEMRPLARRLAPGFRTLGVDWPGFGDRPRPRLDWSPDLLSRFLAEVIAGTGPLAAIVAAGHAATYALRHLAAHPGSAGRLVLVAPTWRGPLPTMMGGPRPWFARIRAALDAPVLGPMLYAANLSRFVVERMAREHVYSDPAFLDAARLAEKRGVTTAPGARHASVRFVTGALDRVGEREAFLALLRGAGVPVLLVHGAETPPRSRAEMEAAAAVPGVAAVQLPRGKLGLHEEFADAVGAEILAFLSGR